MSNPEDLLYSASHEWAKVNGEEAVLGITHFAQESLGDITYVDMPAEGDELTAGSEFGAVDSVKAASDLISPVSGTVVAVNTELENAPEVMNSDPYGAWLIKVENVEGSEELLDAAAYEAFCTEEG